MCELYTTSASPSRTGSRCAWAWRIPRVFTRAANCRCSLLSNGTRNGTRASRRVGELSRFNQPSVAVLPQPTLIRIAAGSYYSHYWSAPARTVRLRARRAAAAWLRDRSPSRPSAYAYSASISRLPHLPDRDAAADRHPRSTTRPSPPSTVNISAAVRSCTPSRSLRRGPFTTGRLALTQFSRSAIVARTQSPSIPAHAARAGFLFPYTLAPVRGLSTQQRRPAIPKPPWLEHSGSVQPLLCAMLPHGAQSPVVYVIWILFPSVRGSTQVFLPALRPTTCLRRRTRRWRLSSHWEAPPSIPCS